jgi:hypothetical protein
MGPQAIDAINEIHYKLDSLIADSGADAPPFRPATDKANWPRTPTLYVWWHYWYPGHSGATFPVRVDQVTHKDGEIHDVQLRHGTDVWWLSERGLDKQWFAGTIGAPPDPSHS